MSIPSNSYAEKVFAEHPLGLWALDESIHFISLINNKTKKIIPGTGSSEWEITGGTAEVQPSDVVPPIKNLPIISFISSVNEVPTTGITLKSKESFTVSNLDSNKGSFTISAYLNTFASGESGTFEIGYQIGSNTPVLESFNVEIPTYWQFVSYTFSTSGMQPTDQIKIILKTESSTAANNYFLINGLSVGQWSENFSSYDTGVTSSVENNILSSTPMIDLPTTINLTTSKATYAYGYGISEYSGYYLASSNKLFAYNDGVPMVFGANSVTKIIPRPNDLPSLIIPGFGFMNKAGQYQDLTFETWIRIKSSTTTPKKIIGPITSDDGLYVDGPFLILKINNYFGTYQVGEWERPMLVQIRLSNNSASLLVNGEQVISLNILTSSLIFPKQFSTNNKEQDWIGFYAYEDVPLIEIDCPAIYSYVVPEILAKKRFVYGQGVSFPNNTSANLDSFSAFVDYKVSDFGNNYLYPDKGVWNRALKDNVSITRNSLSNPKYLLPEIQLNNNMAVQEWLDICKARNENNEENSFVDFGISNGGYFLFNNFNFLSEGPTKAFYGIFKQNTQSLNEQILFKIVDEVTGNNLTIVVEDEDINYKFTYNNQTKIIYSDRHVYQSIFGAGIDIDKFISYFGGNLAIFFANRNRLKIYIGGEPGFSINGNVVSVNSFNGKVYKIDFLTQRNLSKFTNIFDPDDGVILDNNDLPLIESIYPVINYDGGFPESQNEEYTLIYYGGSPSTSSWTQTLDSGTNIPLTISDDVRSYISSYTLWPQEYSNTFSLDIGTDSYWQDYVPLKTLGKQIINEEGKQEYGLDYVQFNIDYPRLEKFTNNNYNLANSLVKTYISFQYVGSGANLTDQNLTTVPLDKTDVVIPDTNWSNKKYQVLDNTIIYMPPSVDFKTLAIVVHIDLTSSGIINKPIKIKNMHLAGRALNKSQETSINTKFGVKLYPYYKTGIYPNYKAKNPVSIYKESTPHLYLNNNSGVLLKELSGNTDTRGIRLPVNYNRLSEYSVGAIQITMKYEKNSFPTTETKIFEIECKNNLNTDLSYIDFYIISSSSDNSRGKLIARTRSSTPNPIYSGINYFINGNFTKELNIFAGQWNMIGLQFSPSIKFNSNNNFTGSFNIVGQILVNNIVVYQGPALEEINTFRYRYWSEIASTGESGSPKWSYVSTSDILWSNVLFAPVQRNFVINTQEIYKNYTQSNKIIASDEIYTVFNNFQYSLYTDLAWKSSSITPA